MEHSYCEGCASNIENSCLDVYDIDGVTLVSCPRCGMILSAKAEGTEKVDCRCDEYALTVDQCNYTIHCLSKQEGKLKHALAQVYNTIYKLEVLRELAKEKESINGCN